MIVTRFFDPGTDSVVAGSLASADGLSDLVRVVLAKSSDRGSPAIEFTRSDGSSATLAVSGQRAAVIGVDSLGETSHSVGTVEGPALVYDYMGSWSEVPGGWTVALSDAVHCLRQFIETGSPDTESVLYLRD